MNNKADENRNIIIIIIMFQLTKSDFNLLNIYIKNEHTNALNFSIFKIINIFKLFQIKYFKVILIIH